MSDEEQQPREGPVTEAGEQAAAESEVQEMIGVPVIPLLPHVHCAVASCGVPIALVEFDEQGRPMPAGDFVRSKRQVVLWGAHGPEPHEETAIICPDCARRIAKRDQADAANRLLVVRRTPGRRL